MAPAPGRELDSPTEKAPLRGGEGNPLHRQASQRAGVRDPNA